MAALFGMASTAFAVGEGFDVELVESFGTGCPDPSIISLERADNGEFFIQANFNPDAANIFAAATDEGSARATTNCTIRYNVVPEPGVQLESLQLSVDGEYQLSNGGRALFSVRQTVPGVTDPVFGTASFRAGNDPADGVWNITSDFVGLGAAVNQCNAAGSVVPIEVQVRGSARRARNDTDNTAISVFLVDGADNLRRIRVIPAFARCN